MTNQELTNDLIHQGVLKSPQIIDAFQTIDRADFVPDQLKSKAYANTPLPIGHGQTISQPYTVAFMLELLQPNKGHNILDIGSGSGWTVALLAHIVGANGHVTSLELIPEVCEYGTNNIKKYNFIEKGIVETHCLNANDGFKDNAPYDRIIAAAEVNDIPQPWLDQLTIGGPPDGQGSPQRGGRLVTPIHNSLVLIEKTSDNAFTEKKYPGFVFVPFIPNDL